VTVVAVVSDLMRSAGGLAIVLALAACSSGPGAPGDRGDARAPADAATADGPAREAAVDGGAADDAASSLVILQNQVPAVMGGACVVGLDSSTLEASGTFDVALDHAYPYYLYPLLRNQGTAIEVTQWSVSIAGPAGTSLEWPADCPDRFDFPSPASLNPGDLAALAIEALRPCHGDHLRALFAAGRLPTSFNDQVWLMVAVQAKGRSGATTVRSLPFQFPVRACYGCLQTGFAAADYADYSFPRLPLCSALTANPYRGNPCNPAQDVGPILCCALDSEGKHLQCPALAP
jgi:hypothetical protein